MCVQREKIALEGETLETAETTGFSGFFFCSYFHLRESPAQFLLHICVSSASFFFLFVSAFFSSWSVALFCSSSSFPSKLSAVAFPGCVCVCVRGSNTGADVRGTLASREESITHEINQRLTFESGPRWKFFEGNTAGGRSILRSRWSCLF